MRIHLLGASGAGTSTLGKRIADYYKIPWFDSDDFYWEPTDPPFSIIRKRNERIELLKSTLDNHKSWVLSGSVLGWGDFIKTNLDFVIYMYLEKELRIKRLINREKEKFGERIEPGYDMYKNHQDFINWAMQYDTGDMNMRSKISENIWMEDLTCPIIRIEEYLEIDEEISLVVSKIEEYHQISVSNRHVPQICNHLNLN
jgi:adenylate kinase family enzyme